MSLFDPDVEALAVEAISALSERKMTLSLAESCTGGLVASVMIGVPGASAVFDRGFVTYSNESKAQVLMINPDMIITHGSVSPEVASSMAYNARRLSRCDVGFSITGVAGPGGGSAEKPVGLVYFGMSTEGDEIIVHKESFGDIGRNEIRMKSVSVALSLLRDHLPNPTVLL